ncbi:hypothetical protein [Mesorhizobium caraganae]|uniref:hypothetical protein n=1 Tax=Mesorhizobium caraganae TaxID=483206 RepID=UPI003ECF552B
MNTSSPEFSLAAPRGSLADRWRILVSNSHFCPKGRSNGFQILKDLSLLWFLIVLAILRQKTRGAAIQRSDLAIVGRLMVASHISARDGFEIIIPKLDELIDSMKQWRATAVHA